MAKKPRAILKLVDGTIITDNKILTGRFKLGDPHINHAGQDYEILRIERPDLADPAADAADKDDPKCQYIVRPVA